MADAALTGGSVARGLGDPQRIAWPLVRSSELFQLRYGKALTATTRRAGDVPVFGTNGQTGSHDTVLFEGPGVILGRKGAGHLGVHWSDRDYWVIDTAYSLAVAAQVDIRFAYYLIGYTGLDHLKHGTSNPSLTREAFGAQFFPVPPMPAQKAIAATLGALDDKIQSNRRLCALLDNLARTQFLVWRSGLARVDETTFGDFAEVFGGATPNTSNPAYWDGDLAWTTPTDVTRLAEPYLFETTRRISPEGLGSCATVMHPPGSIMMTSRATIGYFAVNQVPMSTNQGFIVVRPRQESHRWFLFEEMRSRVGEFIDNANGSTFLEISRGRFKALPLRIPEDDDFFRLDQVLAPLHAKAAQASLESERLANLRSALLPELLSGRMRASELVGDAAAIGRTDGQS